MNKNGMITGCLLLLVITIAGSPVMAQENISLGLSQMAVLAISNNLEFKKANYQLENIKLEVRGTEAQNLFTESTITNLQKKMILLNQQNQFRLEKDRLLIQVVDDYFQLLIAEKGMERKNKNIELEKMILEDVKNQVEAGYSVDLDLLQQTNKYYDALFSYQESLLDYKELLIEVKNTLGIEPEKEILLTQMQIPEFPEIHLDDAINQSRQNSLVLKSQTMKTDQSMRELEKAKAGSLPEIEVLKLENSLAITQLEKSLSQQDLDYQVETQWLNYNQAKNDILLSQKNIEQMKKDKLIIQRQFQAGLRTKDETISATIGVLDAESRLISSVRQIYHSYLELQRLMGTLDKGVIQ